MIYSPSGKVLFVHVSRTGGTSIEACLREAFPDARQIMGQHDFLADARPVLGAAFGDTFKFAFVRNPWDRLVSWYALIAKATAGRGADPKALADPETPHWHQFDAFLDTWSRDVVEVNGVLRPKLSQWAQLSDAEGVLLVDEVGRFERLAGDVVRLFGQMGSPVPELPQINTSSHLHYRHYYSDYGRELVSRVFHEDVEHFGYLYEE